MIAEGDPDRSRAVARSLVDLLARRGRAAESVVVESRRRGTALRSRRAWKVARAPWSIVTTAVEPLSTAHLDPLLAAIDHCDHVVGRRRASLPVRVLRRAAWLACRVALRRPGARRPFADPGPSPRQARGDPAPVVVVLPGRGDPGQGHVLRPSDRRGRGPAPGRSPRGRYYWLDFVEVFRRPVLVRPPASAPAEDPQGDDEGDDRPGGEDGQGDRCRGRAAPPLRGSPGGGRGSAGSGAGPGSAAGRRRGSDRRRRRPPRGATSAASPGSSGR